MAEPLPEFGDLPLVVTAERQQRLQGGESAPAERTPEAVELGEGGANLALAELGVAQPQGPGVASMA